LQDGKFLPKNILARFLSLSKVIHPDIVQYERWRGDVQPWVKYSAAPIESGQDAVS
jgi:hypothetical protein